MTTPYYYDGRRVKKPRYKLGTKVYIRALNGGPYNITRDEYREYQKEWHYKVNGKWWSEKSLRKARTQSNEFAPSRSSIKKREKTIDLGWERGKFITSYK